MVPTARATHTAKIIRKPDGGRREFSRLLSPDQDVEGSSVSF
jgi:hypothetical protein